MKKRSNNRNRMTTGPLAFFSKELIAAMAKVEKSSGNTFYISGGTVRDWLLGRKPVDLDITVKKGAVRCCRELIKQLGGGAFVMLGTEDEEAARIVWQDCVVDFSSYRKGAETLEEDLAQRDFTINGMAMAFYKDSSDETFDIIDPFYGKKDLEDGVLSCCRDDAFINDPLRMLRGYRFCAELEFELDEQCCSEIKKQSSLIGNSAAERVQYELNRIMTSGRAATVLKAMSETTLLWHIFPELEDGLGMEQPGFHHEDVFHHNLLALQCVEKVITRPQDFFSDFHQSVFDYLQVEGRKNFLRWSALFHDLGKPTTYSSGTIKPDRITFYKHDQAGRKIFSEIAARLKWSRTNTEVVGRLIELHMHPFHLCNVRRDGAVSRKACLKICKKTGEDLPGLFVLAMADSLAGQGELKPENMEEELAQLFDEVQRANENLIQPLMRGKRILSGHDLIRYFNLTPGPVFSRIFKELEVAMVEEKVRTRMEALAWVGDYLKRQQSDGM